MAGDLMARIRRNIVADEPLPKGLRFAAVSMILRDPNSPSVLLIERARRADDPWSGQIAFPGGKMQDGDGTARDTAIRETKEEVGIDLEATADFLGYGEVSTTHTGTMDVVPSVFALNRQVEVRANEEVASFRWIALEELLAPAARSSHQFGYKGNSVEMPAFAVGRYVVWGLTYRILSTLLGESEMPPFTSRRRTP
jgi:8-oxo-dGTP pyrophosphatase MutT (NUDIX family)